MYIDWRSSNPVLAAWKITSLPKDQLELFPISGEPNGYAGFLLQPLTDGYVVALPYWLLLFTFCVGVAAPQLRWRFTLRTLLIATTLVAVVLGLIMWLSR
jgi:hypothetical protein